VGWPGRGLRGEVGEDRDVGWSGAFGVNSTAGSNASSLVLEKPNCLKSEKSRMLALEARLALVE